MTTYGDGVEWSREPREDDGCMLPCAVCASFLPAASVQGGGGGPYSGGSSRQTHRTPFSLN
jgi:hypothetical protein